MIAPNRYRFYRFRSMIPWLIMIMSNAWRVLAATSNQINSTERVKNSRPFSQTCFSWQVVQAWDSRALASLARPYKPHSLVVFSIAWLLAFMTCAKMRAFGHCAKSREARKALSKSCEADTKSQKDSVQIAKRENTLPFPKRAPHVFYLVTESITSN